MLIKKSIEMVKKEKNIIKSVFIFMVSILLLEAGCIYGAEKISIKGIVSDSESNEPIGYCSISVAGSPDGAITNRNGFFEIQTSDRKNIRLVASHVNYKKKSVEYKRGVDTIRILLDSKSILQGELIVSGALYEQDINRLSKPASVISKREIMDNMQSNMIDMLASKPGFTQVWEYHSPIILRGMNSKRILIMKDGNRRIGTFPGGFFAQDMNIYDTRNVEIVKGPGSVIYGSGAISGIVNIVSPDPFDADGLNVKFMSGYGSNNNEVLEYLKVCYGQGDFGVSVNGKFRETSEMYYGNGDIAENSNVKDADISINSGIKITECQDIIIDASYHSGDWGKPRGFNGPGKEFTRIRNEEERFHASVKYNFIGSGLVNKIQFSSYFDGGKRDYYKYKYSTISNKVSSLDLVHYKDNYCGFRIFSVFDIFKNNKFTAGLDGYLFTLDNPADLIDYYYNTKGREDGYTDAGQKNIGIFINNEWEITGKLRLISGIRADYAKVNEGQSHDKEEKYATRDAISGNAGLVWSPDENNHFSLNIGRAFRMPTAEELFTEVISCKGTKAGNPELEPEYSWGFDLGFRGAANSENLKYDLALFYNILDNFINEMLFFENPDIDFTYKNTDAINLGGEASVSYQFDNVLKRSNDLFFGAGLMYVYGIDKSDKNEDKPLFGTPPFSASVEMDYRGLLGLSWLTGYFIKARVEYASRQNRVAEIPEGSDAGPWGYEPSESHVVINLGIGLNSNSLPLYPKIRLNIKNLLDTDYKPFGSYIPAIGRNIKIALMLSI